MYLLCCVLNLMFQVPDIQATWSLSSGVGGTLSLLRRDMAGEYGQIRIFDRVAEPDPHYFGSWIRIRIVKAQSKIRPH
jgi:hypothetical protein